MGTFPSSEAFQYTQDAFLARLEQCWHEKSSKTPTESSRETKRRFKAKMVHLINKFTCLTLPQDVGEKWLYQAFERFFEMHQAQQYLELNPFINQLSDSDEQSVRKEVLKMTSLSLRNLNSTEKIVK